MRPLLATLAIVLTVAVGCTGSSGGGTLVAIGGSLEGPRGTHATVWARGIPNMSAFAWDATGRLWVTRSGSSQHARDGVYVIAHAGATPRRVIGSIRGPLGLVWLRGSLFVSYLGGVDRFDGFSGGRFARRTTVLDGPVAGAENNNLVVGPGGKLLLGVSAICDHCATTPRYSGAIVSFAPDGSHLSVFADGIRAAYGLLYRDGTVYASMNQRDDLDAKTPGDWLAVVRQGETWGFPGCYGQGGMACANVPAPLAVLDKHAAAGGLAVRDGKLLVSEWVVGTVLSVPVGGGTAKPFLTGLTNPLPLIVAPDGALLVGEWGTGTIYRITS